MGLIMEYRAKRQLNPVVSLLLYGVVWVGVLGIAWNLFKPQGWLSWAIDLILSNETTGIYYLAVAALAVFAAKYWLDSIGPYAFRATLIMICAFAGTIFIMGLLLPL